MSSENPKRAGLKEKAIHETKQFIGISLYLTFFFCAGVTYRMLMVNDSQDSFFNYGAAVINALVIAKVILIGEYAHLGKRFENRPLLLSAVYKSFLFGLLVFAFHIVEEVIKHLLHGRSMTVAFNELRFDEMLARTVLVFCTFIPFFAFRELRRVLGEEKFQSLLFHGRSEAAGQATE